MPPYEPPAVEHGGGARVPESGTTGVCECRSSGADTDTEHVCEAAT